jgi:hypothetical protein
LLATNLLQTARLLAASRLRPLGWVAAIDGVRKNLAERLISASDRSQSKALAVLRQFFVVVPAGVDHFCYV